MKKFSVLFLAMLFCFVCSCGNSGSKEKDDSDQIGETDVDTTDDSDTVDNSDKDRTNDSDSGKTDDSDTQEAVTDSDTADDSDTEKDDSDPIESGICSPNPCDTAENQAAHKTRCMPENNGTSYTCECDASYYSYGDICCPAHSSEKGGKCQCDTYYVEPEEEPGKCVAACSENTIEGLNGYCKGDYICQQGTCIKDRCAGYSCPENSTCTTKNDEPFCQCDSPLQMSSGKWGRRFFYRGVSLKELTYSDTYHKQWGGRMIYCAHRGRRWCRYLDVGIRRLGLRRDKRA